MERTCRYAFTRQQAGCCCRPHHRRSRIPRDEIIAAGSPTLVLASPLVRVARNRRALARSRIEARYSPASALRSLPIAHSGGHLEPSIDQDRDTLFASRQFAAKFMRIAYSNVRRTSLSLSFSLFVSESSLEYR